MGATACRLPSTVRVVCGDLLVLVPSPYGLTYLPPGAAPPARHLFGAHGGLEAEEMQVPRVVLPFAALDAPAAQS